MGDLAVEADSNRWKQTWERPVEAALEEQQVVCLHLRMAKEDATFVFVVALDHPVEAEASK